MSGAQRTPKMQKLLDTMRTVKEKAEGLEYESLLLAKRQQLNSSWKKQRAASSAWAYWRKLNREYKSLWKAQRRKQSDHKHIT